MVLLVTAGSILNQTLCRHLLTRLFYVNGIMREAMRNWGQNNVQEALNFAHRLPTNLKLESYRSLSNAWAEKEPFEAAQFFLQNLEKGKNKGVLQGVVSKWAESNPVQATQWIDGLAEKDLKKGLWRSVLSGWARQDLGGAKKYLERSQNLELIENSAGNVARQISKDLGIGESVSWLAGLSQRVAGKKINQALRGEISRWVDQDLEGAKNYVSQSAAQGATRDVLLREVSWKIGENNSYEGIHWASRIQDAQLREYHISSIAASWYKKNPKAARSWIENSNLSIEAKTKLLKGQKVYLKEFERR